MSSVGRRPSAGCAGQALVEVLLVGLLLLVPLVWALGVLGAVHRGALAASAAARAGGFEAARTSGRLEAESALREAVERALRDHGLSGSGARVRWALPGGLERGGSVEVEVAVPIEVLSAPLLGRVAPATVWIRAAHSARIDPYRSRA